MNISDLVLYAENYCANYDKRHSTLCPEMNGEVCYCMKADNSALFRQENQYDPKPFEKTGKNQWENTPCLLSLGKRCVYFESCVMRKHPETGDVSNFYYWLTDYQREHLSHKQKQSIVIPLFRELFLAYERLVAKTFLCESRVKSLAKNKKEA